MVSDPISELIKARIQNGLEQVAAEEQVTILYACESGSRAWGFASSDSDYDVRFIYLRRTAWYLTTQPGRDVIERPIDAELDISGWDLPKALRLLRKSNPPLLEWLQSPIVYRETSSLRARLATLRADYYSPIACMYHYLKMAENNCRKYLQDDPVWTKKYFYVLRPMLACRWIEAGCGVVPIEFSKLVSHTVTDPALAHEIARLLAVKIAGEELSAGPKNAVISTFIETELARFQAVLQPPAETRDPVPLNQVFRALLAEVNGPLIGG